jgi:predicted amidophosphoribosyltransferase
MSKVDDTYCPHCWAAVKTYDTTCWQCGDEITLEDEITESDREESDKAIDKILFAILCTLIATVITMIGKGEIQL